jgi:hypothetical protein
MRSSKKLTVSPGKKDHELNKAEMSGKINIFANIVTYPYIIRIENNIGM